MNTSYGFMSQTCHYFLKKRLCFVVRCFRLTLRIIGFEFFFYAIGKETGKQDISGLSIGNNFTGIPVDLWIKYPQFLLITQSIWLSPILNLPTSSNWQKHILLKKSIYRGCLIALEQKVVDKKWNLRRKSIAVLPLLKVFYISFLLLW